MGNIAVGLGGMQGLKSTIIALHKQCAGPAGALAEQSEGRGFFDLFITLLGAAACIAALLLGGRYGLGSLDTLAQSQIASKSTRDEGCTRLWEVELQGEKRSA